MNTPKDIMIGGTHYRDTKFQPWDVIQDWQHADAGGFETYLWGNCLKYLQRYRRKGRPVEDLEKVRHYLDQLIQEVGELRDVDD